ncbi:MAG: zinc ribbon domain-containing protein [Deltaproteobacteria bacterium]|nr:zinc ribbon domain-containing protein [Deltaproteobacteria bacterium]
MSAGAPQSAPCLRCRGPLEPGDLRCAICGLACPAPSGPAVQRSVQILRCTQCGAAVSYSAEAQAPLCRFCASVMRIEQPVDPVDQADWILPFAVAPELAQAALRQWLGSLGFFRPGDLATSATLAGLHPIWWAAWIVDASALVSWTADSNAGAQRAAWAPHAGQAHLPLRGLLVSASRGLGPDEAARLAPCFQLGSALPVGQQPAERIGPAGAVLEQFDVQRSAARRTIVEAILATAAAALQQGAIPGSSFRNVHVAALLEDMQTRRVALPTYVLAYRYGGGLYRAIVHGQDARCVLGKAPLSVAKILLVVAAVLLAIVALVGALVVGCLS